MSIWSLSLVLIHSRMSLPNIPKQGDGGFRFCRCTGHCTSRSFYRKTFGVLWSQLCINLFDTIEIYIYLFDNNSEGLWLVSPSQSICDGLRLPDDEPLQRLGPHLRSARLTRQRAYGVAVVCFDFLYKVQWTTLLRKVNELQSLECTSFFAEFVFTNILGRRIHERRDLLDSWTMDETTTTRFLLVDTVDKLVS